VILEGARATGKTWLVGHAIEQGWLRETRSFSDQTELNAARAAPRDYVFGLPHGTAIDEAQLCEDILLPIKERIETNQVGALLLTGSTRLRRDALGGSDPLAGRVGSPLHLAPLTIGERSGEPVHLVGQLFDERPESIEISTPITRTDLVELVLEPGLPAFVTDLSGSARDDRARAYLDQVTSLSSFASVDVQRVGQLARYLAGRTSTTVNINQFASDVELARQSVTKYLAHLEEALVVVRLPGWRRAKDKSETDRAKLHFFDAGIACAAARMRPGEQDDDLGRLVETLLVTDLVRQSSWLSDPPSCYHWRYKNRDEVDLILEDSAGRAVCVEAKAAENVTAKDFRGIDAFRERHPEAFHRGFVFYSGRSVQPFGSDRWAIPFAALRRSAREPRISLPVRAMLQARESTLELWARVLPRLVAMTAAGAIGWEDADEGVYVATTDSGAIRITRLFAPGMPMSARIASVLASDLPSQTSMTMYDAKGDLVAELEPPEQLSMISVSSLSAVARDERLIELHKLADDLLTLIERTPNAASGVADNILAELDPS